MKRAKIFISFFIALTFVFPSIYQAIHVVQIHWSVSSAHSCSCSNIKETKNDVRYSYPHDTKKPCAVCEFEFASFSRTKNIKLGSVSSVYTELLIAYTQKVSISNCNEVVTLRGPPLRTLT